MNKVSLSVFLIIAIAFSAFSQTETDKKDKNKGDIIAAISGFYAFESAEGDLSSRFGFNHRIGAAFSVKLENNWVFEIEGSFLFGDDLKEEAYSILDAMKTEDNQLTSRYGTPGNIMLTERGTSFMLKAGKILPFLQTNNNSGPFIMGGIGFLEHKIRIDNEGNDTPQIGVEYRKGYDHLTNGIAFSQFVGYRHYADNKMFNFYIGLEWAEAFTKNRRGYNYNTMEVEGEARIDILSSVKCGIVIPFSKRSPKAFYIN